MRFVLALEEGKGEHQCKYSVIVPGLPGCFSAGDNLVEAIDSSIEAIDAHVELLLEDNQGLPEQRSADEYFNDEEYAGMRWAVIEVPVEKYFGPAEKINITVPALTLKRIDEIAARRGESRSGFLVRAAEAAMSHKETA